MHRKGLTLAKKRGKRSIGIYRLTFIDMKTARIYAQKALAGLAISLFMAGSFVPSVHAQVYYYPSTYQTQTSTNAQIQALLNQVYALMAQIKTLQQNANYTTTYTVTPYVPSTSYTNYGTYYYPNYYQYNVQVTTEGSNSIDRNSEELQGSVSLNGAPYANVWFEYGSNGNITSKSDSRRLSTNDNFTIDVDGLNSNSRYYYRAVSEDPSGTRDYGSLMSFTTGSSNNNNNYCYDRYNNRYYCDSNHNNGNEPDATTQGADNVSSGSVELHGRVDMNDFENGTVFFVYGKDRNKVEDVENEDRFGSIYEYQQDLQKVQVYSNLDGSRTFWDDEYGLDSNSRYYYRICVGYEDNNNDDAITCGDVENFYTNN